MLGLEKMATVMQILDIGTIARITPKDASETPIT
jgi:hypothetical protein